MKIANRGTPADRNAERKLMLKMFAYAESHTTTETAEKFGMTYKNVSQRLTSKKWKKYTRYSVAYARTRLIKK